MDGRKHKHKKYNRKWIRAKRTAVSIISKENRSIEETYSDKSDECDEFHTAASSAPGDNVEIVQNELNDYDGEIHHSSTDEDEESLANIWAILNEDLQVIDSSSSEDDQDTGLGGQLVSWINDHNIKHAAADDLLKILKRHGHEELPSSTRTLLQTDRKVNTEIRSNMDYYNMGLRESLLKNFEKYPENVKQAINTIELGLNIDGLPLFKSSNISIWPVLCCIYIQPVKVFPVVLTCGNSKPSNLDFLLDTVEELNSVIQEGIIYLDKCLKVVLKCIVCDAPARALVKATKLCSGYYGCERCTQKGKWFGRVTYPEVNNLVRRTDTSFRNQLQKEHHQGVSPLEMLPIDMVNSFPMDYMHQGCLGTMRRMLFLWTKGPRTVKLSANQKQLVSQKLLEIKHAIPKLFARKPRGLEDLERWKATEYRQFMLYTGKLALKEVLQPDLYKHFLAFSVAMAILVSPRLVNAHLDYARSLLDYFVKRGRELYGHEFLVYNVHAMVHIADDAKEFGCLHSCSGFPFESYLGRLKRMVRSGNKPLEQLVKRIHELERSPESQRFINQSKLMCVRPNNAFVLLDTGKCCETLALTGEKDDMGRDKYLCRIYNQCGPLFQEPCDSRIIGAYNVHPDDCSVKILSSISLQTPAIMIEKGSNGHTVFLAVLHNAHEF